MGEKRSRTSRKCIYNKSKPQNPETVICSKLTKAESAQWRRGDRKAIQRSARATHNIQGDGVQIHDTDEKCIIQIEPKISKKGELLRPSKRKIPAEFCRELVRWAELEKNIGLSNVAKLQRLAGARFSNIFTAIYWKVPGHFWVGQIAEFPHDGIALGKSVSAARQNLKCLLRATIRKKMFYAVESRGPDLVVEQMTAGGRKESASRYPVVKRENGRRRTK